FGQTSAYIGQGATIHAGGVTIVAFGGTTTVAEVHATGLHAFGGGEVKSEADSGGVVEAYIGRQAASSSTTTTTVDVGGGTIIVSADADLESTATAHGSGGGIIDIGALLPHADTSGRTSAYVRDNVDITAGTMKVVAGDYTDDNDRPVFHSKAASYTFSVSVGGGSGVTPHAETTGTIEAFLGAPAGIAGVHPSTTQTHVSGTLTVRARGDVHAEATAEGTGLGGVAAAIQNATSDANATTRAYVGDGGDVSAGALNITADASLLSDAVTHAVTVGFASINGAPG